MLRSFLAEDSRAVLDERCQLYAPDPKLRRQYAQSDDNKRFEYSLSQELPPEVLAKRKLSTNESDSDSDPFQIPALTEVVNTLCPELRPAETFCIVSEAGSRDQVPHTDSIPMEGQSDESWQSSLHYIGALIPLQATNALCGQTAVIPTSHLNPYAVEEIKLSMHPGDVLLMDGRTTHRGLANVTTSPSLETTSSTGSSSDTIGDKDNDGGADGGDGEENVIITHHTTPPPPSSAPAPRKICFFTYTLPHVTDGNALAYSENKKEETSSSNNSSSSSSVKKDEQEGIVSSKKVKTL